MTDPQGRKGQLEIIWQRSFRLLSLSSSFVDLCWEHRRILWQPGERLAAALSSSIVRAQVPASADHFNQLNATDTACCCEPSGPIQRGPQMDAAAEAFRQTSAANKCYVGWRWRRGEDGGHGTCRQHSDNLSARACWFLSPLLPHLYKGYTAHLIWYVGDGPLFSSKVHTSLFLSPFVDPWALKYV